MIRSTSYISFFWLSIILIYLIALPDNLIAQDIGVGLNTTHDENIFDTYNPLKDQVTQLNLDLSKGWDSDNSYWGVFYAGSLSLYSDLSARNNHIQMVMASMKYHFVHEEPKVSETENDSTDAESDSTAEVGSTEIIHSDSLDHFINTTIFGAAQFNKVDYEEWDNATASGSIIFRQPLGLHASIRPSYTLAFHSYPNISALTNIQNIISLHIGTDFLEGSWLALTPTYAFESYTETQQFSDTLHLKKVIKGKHGSAMGGLSKVVSINLSTPSVQQLALSLLWNYKPVPGTEFTTQITRYAKPSKEARAVPQLRRGAAKLKSFIVNIDLGQNNLYDDHFSYYGNELTVQAKQLLPLDLILEVSLQYQKKTYTYQAMDLSDTIVVASNREDKRTEIAFNFSKNISLGEDSILKLEFEYHTFNNGSNAPYYDFKKNTFMVGAEYNF